jgi:hypothetical protein
MMTEPGATQTRFEPSRAFLMRRDIFPPLHVGPTRSLRDALATGDLRRDAPVLVVEQGAAATVLLTRQLTYHHVAQGEVGGEPWMVSF